MIGQVGIEVLELRNLLGRRLGLRLCLTERANRKQKNGNERTPTIDHENLSCEVGIRRTEQATENRKCGWRNTDG
jgi:hypothetical protein